MGTIIVAGLCVRPLAESARLGGWQVVALDLFGDADTRRASLEWHRLGDAARFVIDPALLRDALCHAAGQPDVVGWIAGSGFEAIPEALGVHIPGLPLLGMPAAAVRRLRDPAGFFATLVRLGLEHPEVAFAAPRRPEGWLVKNAAGSGGWHIRPAGQNRSGTHGSVYHQRIQAGEPMSALFLADGTRARLVGLNRLLVEFVGDSPYVYAGAIGPVRHEALTRQVEQALAALVPAFGLRGLASLDFIAEGGHAWLLEVNPRPSGSMVLYERAWPGGLLRAHVRAVRGELPAEPPFHSRGVRASRTLFAPHACRVGPELAAGLARAPDCHDLPAPGSDFDAGAPVCTLSTSAASAHEALVQLDARATEVRLRLAAREELMQ